MKLTQNDTALQRICRCRKGLILFEAVAAMKSISKKEKTPGYFMTIKMLQFEKFQGKKNTTFRCSNREGSKEISQAIFLLQNPADCLYNLHSGKRVKGRYLRSF